MVVRTAPCRSEVAGILTVCNVYGCGPEWGAGDVIMVVLGSGAYGDVIVLLLWPIVGGNGPNRVRKWA